MANSNNHTCPNCGAPIPGLVYADEEDYDDRCLYCGTKLPRSRLWWEPSKRLLDRIQKDYVRIQFMEPDARFPTTTYYMGIRVGAQANQENPLDVQTKSAV